MVAAVTGDRTNAGIATGIDKAGRIVVKIGSALLIDDETGALRRDWLQSFASDVARMRAAAKRSPSSPPAPSLSAAGNWT